MSNTQAQGWFSQIPEEPKPARHRGLWVVLGVVVVACVVMAGLIVKAHLNDRRQRLDDALRESDRVAAAERAEAARSAAMSAAEAAYRDFVQTSDDLLRDPGTSALPLSRLATGKALRVKEAEIQGFRSNKWKAVGQTTIPTLAVLTQAQDQISLHACLDVTKASIVDATGANVTPKTRSRWFTSTVYLSLTPTDQKWRVYDFTLLEATGCAK